MQIKEYNHLKEYFQKKPSDWRYDGNFIERKLTIIDEPLMKFNTYKLIPRIFRIDSRSTTSDSKWWTYKARIFDKSRKISYKKKKDDRGNPISLLQDPTPITKEEQKELEKILKEHNPEIKEVIF